MVDEQRPVTVDRIGTPAAAPSGLRNVCLIGGPETVATRLRDAGVERLALGLDEIADVDLVVVSTRIARSELSAALRQLREGVTCPIVALAHTGGEALAVEIVRAGAAGVVAEGNESALEAFLVGGVHDMSLVETYDRQTSRAVGDSDPSRGRDEVTGLPRESALSLRLLDYGQADDVPRIAFLRVLHLDAVARRLSPAATALIRRRLAVQYREIAAGIGAELFALGPNDYAVVSDDLTPLGAEAFGRRLAAVTEVFAPSGNRPLGLALGHAGPEVTSELATLRELAQRALIVAAAQARSAVVGADALALGVSATTEMEAAIRLVAYVEQHSGQLGHGLRVADLAAELAGELGYDGLQRSRVRLAAHLHDVGKAGLPVDAMTEGALTGDLLWAYRSHPVRGADYLRVSAGAEVAETVRAQHERWDGAGFPDGTSGDLIPLGARILAVADRFDVLRRGTAGARSLGEALSGLEADSGSRLDPSVVGLAIPLLARLDGSGSGSGSGHGALAGLAS